MKEYNTTDKSEDEIKKLYCNTSFVEVQERTSEGFDYNVLYMNLYKDNEKSFHCMVALLKKSLMY